MCSTLHYRKKQQQSIRVDYLSLKICRRTESCTSTLSRWGVLWSLIIGVACCRGNGQPSHFKKLLMTSTLLTELRSTCFPVSPRLPAALSSHSEPALRQQIKPFFHFFFFKFPLPVLDFPKTHMLIELCICQQKTPKSF